MNQVAQYIKQRLSLREPLQDSLDILAQLADELSLNKEVDLGAELQKVIEKFPTCTDLNVNFLHLLFQLQQGLVKHG